MDAAARMAAISLHCLDEECFYITQECQEESSAISLLKMHMEIVHAPNLGGGGHQKPPHKIWLSNGWILWKLQGHMKRRIGVQNNNKSRTPILKCCQVHSAINIINNQL